MWPSRGPWGGLQPLLVELSECILFIPKVKKCDTFRHVRPSRSWRFAQPKVGLWMCVQWVHDQKICLCLKSLCSKQIFRAVFLCNNPYLQRFWACLKQSPFRSCCCAAVYRADWEPATTSERRALSVFWRYSADLWGPSTPNPTQVSWKTLILKNWPIFPASCGYVVVLPHVAQVRFWRPKIPHSE